MPDDRPAPFPGPQVTPAAGADTGLNLYRDPRREGILTFSPPPSVASAPA